MTFAPTIVTQSDVELAWRTLMQPLGWSRSSTWLMLIGPDGVPLPQLTEIEDCAGPPPTEIEESLGGLLARLREELLPDGSRVAFLRSRPGRGGAGQLDRTWARALYAAARRARLPAEVVHLATDDDVLALPVDDVLLPASA